MRGVHADDDGGVGGGGEGSPGGPAGGLFSSVAHTELNRQREPARQREREAEKLTNADGGC